MAEQIQFEVVTPDNIVVDETVDLVVAPGTEGEFGVLPDHIPFLTSLKVGEMYYRKGNQTDYIAITGGYAEVLPDKVTILAEAAEKARNIDVDRARRAMERAQERLRQAKKESLEYAQAEAALARAMMRLKVAEKQ
jgi:F-type H+-transporting ATPase subunit epsilon